MITSRFFLENKEVIGLWVIYAIVMLLAYCIIETVINSIVSKIKRARRIKRRKMQRQNEFYRLANKARVLANRARVSSQIRAVMSVEL